MFLETDYQKYLEQYLALKTKIIKPHGSAQRYFASLGYEYYGDAYDEIFLKSFENIKDNIEPLIVLIDPTEEGISNDTKIKRLIFLAKFLGNHEHAYTDGQLANGLLKSSLALFGHDVSVIPQQWTGCHSIIDAIGFMPSSSSADELLKDFKEDEKYVNIFITAVLKLKKKQNSILERLSFSSPQEFFTKNHDSLKIDIPAYNHEDKQHRLKAFNSLLEKRNGEAAILSVDPFADITNSDIISSLGFLLQWPDSGVYDPEISEGLFTYGAIHFAEDSSSATMCAFRLGHHYNNGNTGRIDHNAAVFWFDVATRLGHGVAPKFMYQILAREDKRFRDPNEPEFNAYMTSLMQKAEDMGAPCSVEWLNGHYA